MATGDRKAADVPQTSDGTADYGCALRTHRRPLTRALSPAVLAAVAVLLCFPAVAGARDGAPAAAGSGKAAPSTATTDGFQRDRTPLPSDVASGGTTTTSSPSVGTGAGTIVRTIAGLAIVLGMIYGLYWLLKSASRSRGAGGDGRIEVLATTALAPSRSVHLIRAGEEVLLVGAAEGGVTPLRVYTAQEAEELGLVVAPGSLDAVGLTPPESAEGLTRGQRVVEGLRRWTVRS